MKKKRAGKESKPEGMPSVEAVTAWVHDLGLVREKKKDKDEVSAQHKKTVEELYAWVSQLLPERDAIGASLHECLGWIMPPANGTYQVTLGKPFVFTAEGEQPQALTAELTLEAAPCPAQLSEIAFIRTLPWVRASVKATAPLTRATTDAKTGKSRVQRVKDPAGEMLFVPWEALRKALWEEYGVNLMSLREWLWAARFESGYMVGQARINLAKKAFGHSKPFEIDATQGLFSTSVWERRKLLDTGGKTSGYYAAHNVYYLVAFLELVRSKDLKIALPSSDCRIEFKPGQEYGEVTLLEKWGAVTTPAPLRLEARKEYGTASDTLRELLQCRSEITALREQRRGLLERTYSSRIYSGEKRSTTLTDEEKAHDKAIREEVSELRKQDRDIQDKALLLYVELTHWVAKHKARLLEVTHLHSAASTRVEQGREAVKDLVALPNNMGQMPAHFAAIPAGLEAGLHLEKDQYGRAILRVRRQGLHLVGGAAVKEQLPMAFPLDDIKGDIESSAALAQIRLLLGENGPRWLVPQGIVAVSKLYEQGGGYSGAETTVRVYENDWVDTMRPGQVARFREKGRGEAFGKIHKPRDLFNALIGVLNRLTYDSQVNSPLDGWSELNGFYLITGNGEDSRGRWTEIMLNPALHKFIIGDGGLPYMVTNTKAMFCYDKQSLDYSPAAQMGIESFARTNIYNRNTTTLSTPEGGGITRLALANIMGVLRGANENNRDVEKRFNRTLDNLGNAGVIADVKLDGRDKRGAEAFGVKLLVTMHEDYRKAYDLSQAKQELSRLDKALATPFVAPKPSRKKALKSAPAPAPKRRGRPPKK